MERSQRDIIQAEVDRFLRPRPASPKPRDLEFLTTGRIVALNCNLAATAWGEGPIVLLAHGWESRRSHWSAFVPALSNAGFTAIAIDAPAHGDSPGEISHMPLYARMLCQVGRQLGPLHGVIGHSFGAGAAAIALSRGLEAKLGVFIAGPYSILGLIVRWCKSQGIDDEQIPFFLQLLAQVVTSDEADDADRDFHLRVDAERIPCPGLIVHDTMDDDIPLKDAELLNADWKRSRLHITSRYGHKRILIAQSVVQAVVDFLSKRLSEPD